MTKALLRDKILDDIIKNEWNTHNGGDGIRLELRLEVSSEQGRIDFPILYPSRLAHFRYNPSGTLQRSHGRCQRHGAPAEEDP